MIACADLGDLGAVRHRGAEQHRLLALIADLRDGRVLKAAPYGGDVAEAERLVADAQPQFADLLDAEQEALTSRRTERSSLSMRPAGSSVFWAGERGLDVERRETALGQHLGGHLDEDLLVLRAEQVDLGDAGHAQQHVAGVLGVGLQLRIGEALPVRAWSEM